MWTISFSDFNRRRPTLADSSTLEPQPTPVHSAPIWRRLLRVYKDFADRGKFGPQPTPADPRLSRRRTRDSAGTGWLELTPTPADSSFSRHRLTRASAGTGWLETQPTPADPILSRRRLILILQRPRQSTWSMLNIRIFATHGIWWALIFGFQTDVV